MVKATLKQVGQPVIDVQAQVVNTPVDGVNVECTNTAAGLENSLLGSPTQTTSPTAVVAVPRTGTAVARTNRYEDASSGIEGEFSDSDIRFPQLKVVQGSGELSKQFDAGSLIYADQEIFGTPSVKEGVVNPVLKFVPISIKKQWREQLPQEAAAAGEMPRTVDTIAEVEALGGTTQWIGDTQPSWKPSARCLFLIEQPANVDHPGFSTVLDGRNFGVAVYYSAGAAYNASAKVILNAALTSLLMPVLDDAGKPVLGHRGQPIKKPMLSKCFWTFGWAKKQVGNFNPYQPILRLIAKEETGPEVREYIRGLLCGTADAAVAAAE